MMFNLLWRIAALSCCCTPCAALKAELREKAQGAPADDVKVLAPEGGDAAKAVASFYKGTHLQVVENSTMPEAANAIIAGLVRVPAPPPPFRVRHLAPRTIVPGSRDRDYGAPCPLEWLSVGTLFGGATPYCGAGTEYKGPCADDVFSFSAATQTAKEKWSRKCQAYWPPVECERDYSEQCPLGWTPGASTCRPSASYSGHCQGEVDFAGFNMLMLEAWASECGAFWPCRARSGVASVTSMYPVPRDASMRRTEFVAH